MSKIEKSRCFTDDDHHQPSSVVFLRERGEGEEGGRGGRGRREGEEGGRGGRGRREGAGGGVRLNVLDMHGKWCLWGCDERMARLLF